MKTTRIPDIRLTAPIAYKIDWEDPCTWPPKNCIFLGTTRLWDEYAWKPYKTQQRELTHWCPLPRELTLQDLRGDSNNDPISQKI